MYRVLLLLFSLVCVFPAAAGEAKFDPEAIARAIAPFRDEQAFVVIHVDLARIDADKLTDKMVELTKEKREDAVKEMASFKKGLEAFKEAGGKDVFLVFSLADLPDPGFLVVPLHEGTNVAALLEMRQQLHLGPDAEAATIGKALVVGRKQTVARLRNLKAEPYPDLARALAAAGDTTAQILLLPSASSRQIVEQLMPTLPKDLGGGPSTVLTRGIQWAAAGEEFTPKVSTRIVIQSQDTKAAQKLRDWIVRALKRFGDMPELQRAMPNFSEIATMLTPKLDGDRLTLTMDESAMIATLLPAVQKVRTRASEMTSINNLKQIALAMHNYHDVNRNFPPQASLDKSGKPLLSWRVHLLPYLEQDGLYRQFHLDEPWDSAHNRKLIDRMPKVYASPLSLHIEEGKTTYLVPVAKDTIFPPWGKGTRISEITDGTSNTIMIVEAADSHAVIWTKPDDLDVNAKNSVAGLKDGRRSFPVAMADGSVRQLPVTINPATLWAMFTRNGGEEIPNP